MNVWPKRHGCGVVITEEEWAKLPDAVSWPLDDVVLEQRTCPGGCRSSLLIQVSGPDLDSEVAA